MAKLDKFWVVVNPSLTSELSEFMFETNAFDLARYVRGCAVTGSRDDESIAVHDTQYSACVDAGDRVSALRRRLEEINGRIQDSRRDALPKVATDNSDSSRDIWATLRGKVSLPAVVDMVRQDIEALPNCDVEGEALATRLFEHLAR